MIDYCLQKCRFTPYLLINYKTHTSSTTPVPFVSRLHLSQCIFSKEINPLLKPLLNDNFLDWTKWKAFADDKLNAGEIKISVFEWVENIVEKGESAGYQKLSLSGLL